LHAHTHTHTHIHTYIQHRALLCCAVTVSWLPNNLTSPEYIFPPTPTTLLPHFFFFSSFSILLYPQIYHSLFIQRPSLSTIHHYQLSQQWMPLQAQPPTLRLSSLLLFRWSLSQLPPKATTHQPLLFSRTLHSLPRLQSEPRWPS
jgi:hypothetical protein